LLQQSAEIFEQNDLNELPVFFEPVFTDSWMKDYPAVIRILAEFARKNKFPFNLKIRCGGVHASAFPEIMQIASALLACKETNLPFKATAGLHHPLRHYSEEVQNTMHGFVNLFGAAILLHHNKLDAESLAAILADENPASFSWNDSGFRWNNFSVSVAQIQQSRRDFARAFGSCSFTDPRRDLRALNW